MFILSRTFRKIEITVSDNDPWGLIQNPAESKNGGTSGSPPCRRGRQTRIPRHLGSLKVEGDHPRKKERKENYEAADAARMAWNEYVCGRVDGGVQQRPTPAGLFEPFDNIGFHVAGLHARDGLYDLARGINGFEADDHGFLADSGR